MEPFADKLQISGPLLNRLCEDHVLGNSRRERKARRQQKRVGILAVKPQGQRKLYSRALGDGPERIGDD